jgi:surface antigen
MEKYNINYRNAANGKLHPIQVTEANFQKNKLETPVKMKLQVKNGKYKKTKETRLFSNKEKNYVFNWLDANEYPINSCTYRAVLIRMNAGTFKNEKVNNKNDSKVLVKSK